MLIRSSFLTLAAIAMVASLFDHGLLWASDDPVFSGPQVGERLPALPVMGVSGEREGKTFDCVAEASGGPLMIVFFHEKTRPAFALLRAVSQFAESRTDKGMQTYVVILTDNPTQESQWARGIAARLSPKHVVWAVSKDGIEGPGAYGLNRNVTLTVLVGNDGKVTHNSALIQPQLQADGPAILNAIAEVTGGGKVPKISELLPQSMQRRERAQMQSASAKLDGLLRAMINRQAGEQRVKRVAKEIEAVIAKDAAAKRDLVRRVSTIIKSGKLSNYGTPEAQAILQRWHKELKSPPEEYQGESTE